MKENSPEELPRKDVTILDEHHQVAVRAERKQRGEVPWHVDSVCWYGSSTGRYGNIEVAHRERVFARFRVEGHRRFCAKSCKRRGWTLSCVVRSEMASIRKARQSQKRGWPFSSLLGSMYVFM